MTKNDLRRPARALWSLADARPRRPIYRSIGRRSSVHTVCDSYRDALRLLRCLAALFGAHHTRDDQEPINPGKDAQEDVRLIEEMWRRAQESR